MDKLKSCPFCGGNDVSCELDSMFMVYDCGCNKCKITTKTYARKYLSIKAWNRRSPEKKK
jgi:Lar family restriction alleviation protein